MFVLSPLEIVTWGFALYLAVYGGVALGFISRDRVPERSEWWMLIGAAALPAGAGLALAAFAVAVDTLAASFPDYAETFESGWYSAIACAAHAAVHTLGTMFFLGILAAWARWKGRS